MVSRLAVAAECHPRWLPSVVFPVPGSPTTASSPGTPGWSRGRAGFSASPRPWSVMSPAPRHASYPRQTLRAALQIRSLQGRCLPPASPQLAQKVQKQADRYGTHRCLDKPFDLDVLLSHIQELIGRA